MQIAMHARFLKHGWTQASKLELLKFYEDVRATPGGKNSAGFIENVSRDFFSEFTEAERLPVLAGGAKWPSSALSVLAKLPANPGSQTLRQIETLDRQLRPLTSEPARRLRIGIVAVLGTSQDPEAMAYLRELYESEPEHRVPIAMGLAQQPDGDNWPILVRSLSIVEGAAAQEVITKLLQVDQVPEDPEAYRQVILRGLLLREHGGSQAVALLEKWSGRVVSDHGDSWDTALAAWQNWYSEQYPNLAEPKLPVDNNQNHWTQQELLSYLTSSSAHGDAERGGKLFEKAQCDSLSSLRRSGRERRAGSD